MARRVLVVEDPLVRRLIDGILTRGGFVVTQAEPQRALELLEEQKEEFALVVTNVPELFLKHSSNFAMIYLAASPDPQWVEKCAFCRPLAKPFHPSLLLNLANEMLAERDRAIQSAGFNNSKAR